jgi:hypothetical protein
MYNYPPPGYPPPPYGYSGPPKRKPLWPWIVGGVALLAVVILGFTVVVVMKTSHKGENRTVTMTYQVEGTAKTARVSYTGTNNNEEIQEVSLPWSTDVNVGPAVVMTSLTVTTLESGATIECRVMADGRQVAHSGPSPMIVGCMGETGNDWPTPTRNRYRN